MIVTMDDSFRRQARQMVVAMPFVSSVALITFLVTLGFQSIQTQVLYLLSAASGASIGFWLIWIPWIKRRETSHYARASGMTFMGNIFPALLLRPHQPLGREFLISLLQWSDVFLLAGCAMIYRYRVELLEPKAQ